MDDTNKNTNLYIPDLEKKVRNSHSTERAKNFKFNKKKDFIKNKYSNNNVFLFYILEKGYIPINIKLKTKLNTFIESYETYVTNIDEATNELKLKQVVLHLDILVSKINEYINQYNFINFIKNEYFIDKNGNNLRNVEPYSIQIDNKIRERQKQLQQSRIKPGISFADIIKK